MEPTTLATAAIATLFISEAVKAGGKAVGEGTSKLVSQLFTVIRNKFNASKTEGVLTMAEKQPTEANLNRLKDELVAQMEEDKKFANQLRELLAQPEVEEKVRQIGVSSIKITGDLELENITQMATRGNSVEQTGLVNVEAGSMKIGKIIQKS